MSDFNLNSYSDFNHNLTPDHDQFEVSVYCFPKKSILASGYLHVPPFPGLKGNSVNL